MNWDSIEIRDGMIPQDQESWIETHSGLELGWYFFLKWCIGFLYGLGVGWFLKNMNHEFGIRDELIFCSEIMNWDFLWIRDGMIPHDQESWTETHLILELSWLFVLKLCIGFLCGLGVGWFLKNMNHELRLIWD